MPLWFSSWILLCKYVLAFIVSYYAFAPISFAFLAFSWFSILFFFLFIFFLRFCIFLPPYLYIYFFLYLSTLSFSISFKNHFRFFFNLSLPFSSFVLLVLPFPSSLLSLSFCISLISPLLCRPSPLFFKFLSNYLFVSFIPSSESSINALSNQRMGRGKAQRICKWKTKERILMIKKKCGEKERKKSQYKSHEVKRG